MALMALKNKEFPLRLCSSGKKTLSSPGPCCAQSSSTAAIDKQHVFGDWAEFHNQLEATALALLVQTIGE